MGTITMGVDLAKSVLAVCTVDAAGRVLARNSSAMRLSGGWRRCRRAPSPAAHASHGLSSSVPFTVSATRVTTARTDLERT